MADAITNSVLNAGAGRYAVHLTNVSDGTGEAAAIKVDISALRSTAGAASSTYSSVEFIAWNIQGFASVRLYWDHTTDDTVAILSGGGARDFSIFGGKSDPRTAGGTGDLILTTNGGASGSTYDIILVVELQS